MSAETLQPGGCGAGASRWTNPKITSVDLPADADQATYATVRHMEKLVHGPGGVRSPEVRAAAIEAVKGVARGQAEVDSVYNWVRSNIEFRGEYSESLQEPRVTLQLAAGDCDDHAMLLAALLMSLGHRVRFRTVALRSNPDQQFSHVYLEVQDRRTKQWLPMDTTVGYGFPGWAPTNVSRSKSYRVMNAGAGGNFLDSPLGEFLVLAGLGWIMGHVTREVKKSLRLR